MYRAHSRYCASSKVPLKSTDLFATWEEKAFVEDSSGDLGSIWPPRSYLCSFCGREFRSAQALGGHMNVHRRDRARLKQSQSSQSDDELQVIDPKEKNLPSSLISCTSSDRRSVTRVLSGSVTPDKRSTILSDRMLLPPSPCWSPLTRKQEENKGGSLLGSQSSTYPTTLETAKSVSNFSHSEKLWCVDETSSFGRRPAPSAYCIDEEVSCKRAKISDSCTLPRFLFDRFYNEKDYSLQKSEVIGVKVGSREEPDLELRLGDPPKVK